MNYAPKTELVEGYYVNCPSESGLINRHCVDLSQSQSVDEYCMNRLPESDLVLVPGGTLITDTPEEGRALAMLMARHTVHNIQPNPTILACGRRVYSVDPDSLIAASQVVATEFQTIAAANNYWRKPICYWEQESY